MIGRSLHDISRSRIHSLVWTSLEGCGQKWVTLWRLRLKGSPIVIWAADSDVYHVDHVLRRLKLFVLNKRLGGVRHLHFLQEVFIQIWNFVYMGLWVVLKIKTVWRENVKRIILLLCTDLSKRENLLVLISGGRSLLAEILYLNLGRHWNRLFFLLLLGSSTDLSCTSGLNHLLRVIILLIQLVFSFLKLRGCRINQGIELIQGVFDYSFSWNFEGFPIH